MCVNFFQWLLSIASLIFFSGVLLHHHTDNKKTFCVLFICHCYPPIHLHTGGSWVLFSLVGHPFSSWWVINFTHTRHTSQWACMTWCICVRVHQSSSFCNAQSNWWVKLDGALWTQCPLCSKIQERIINWVWCIMVEVHHTISMDRWLFMVWSMTFLLHQQTLWPNIKLRTYGKRL